MLVKTKLQFCRGNAEAIKKTEAIQNGDDLFATRERKTLPCTDMKYVVTAMKIMILYIPVQV